MGRPRKPKNLLADSDDDDEVDASSGFRDPKKATLSINKAYAKQYEERKKKEYLGRNKHLLEDEEDGESTSSDDEDGVLATPKVQEKFLQTLQKLRSKDTSIYDPEHQFFMDEDFEETNETKDVKKQPLHYGEYLHKTLQAEGASAFVDEEEDFEAKGKVRSHQDELAALKESFKAAVAASENPVTASEVKEAQDGFLTRKEKSREQQEREDGEYRAFLESADGRKAASKEREMLAKFWGDEASLSETDRFLRSYILNQTWREDAQHTDAVAGDDEDEQQLEEAEEFEHSYNFRFEEEGGREIGLNPRKVADSLRQGDDKRKRKRAEKKQRLQEERVRREEELKRLKRLKREEILQKIRQIQQVGGVDEEALGGLDLVGDFDGADHDKQMEQIFGGEYEQQEDSKAFIGDIPEGAESILAPLHGEAESLQTLTKRQRKLKKLQERRQRQSTAVEGYADDAEEIPDSSVGTRSAAGSAHCSENAVVEEELDGVVGEWWMCDACGLGIPSGKKRFDCTVCDNFSLCRRCFRCTRHPHSLVARKVPAHCKPPKDFCGYGMSVVDSGAHDISSLIDEYFSLDYEDMIGDLPTRFKYKKVDKENFGITTEEILNSTDAELNAKVSLKKYAPYRQLKDHELARASLKCIPSKKAKTEKVAGKAMTKYGVRQDRLRAYEFE